MIVEIILPIPVKKTFYYKISDNYQFIPKVGNLVEVDFRNKVLVGIIIKKFKKIHFTKPLKKIRKLYHNIYLNREVIRSINFISSYTCTPISLILKLFLSGFTGDEIVENAKLKQKITEFTGLTSDQNKAINDLNKIQNSSFNVIILNGITGSGKTRVYMHKVLDTIKKGYQCLILVPEIILTSQWVEEISNDFGLSPHIYHSSVSKKKKNSIWQLVNLGKINIVLGTRSSLFLPFSKLGLIIVDEEHDSSYKQQDQIIINARDFAIVRAKHSRCIAILCSATPSVESFYNYKQGKYKRITLTQRINENPLPKISSVDMAREKKIDFISNDLKNEIHTNLKNGHQTLLFINKRGYAPFVICSKCSFTKICKNCNLPLVLHNYPDSQNAQLLCHHCNFTEKFSTLCQNCLNENNFIFSGLGIERVFEQINKLFPNAKTCYLSSDSTKNTTQLNSILKEIVDNKINIIIGTQLISKGHNFPFLKTVGILNIDNLINGFDFRSFEKTYQQIIQVSGRAGRKNIKGNVYIHTYQPKHPVINVCKNYHQDEFYNLELELRKKNQQPPFTNFISLIIASKNDNNAKTFIKKIVSNLRSMFKKIIIYGPAPAIIFKKNNRYRYRVLLKVKKNLILQNKLKSFLTRIVPSPNIKIFIDVDPISFL